MLQKITPATLAPTAPPIRPVRLLVEDPHLAGTDLAPPARGAVEVTVCTGPDDETEACPLVVEGTCPLGPFDVVVGALEGPWARSVAAAWAASSTPYVAAAPTAADPQARLAHHTGVALSHLSGSAGLDQ